MKKLLNIKEVAELLSLSVATIYLYINSRKIPFVKIGSRVLFDEDLIIKWVNEKRIDCINN